MCPPSDESPAYELHLKDGQIPVYRKGKGKQLLIALHGFESDGHLFAPWEKALGEYYTICMPDLPFHGQSKWNKLSFQSADILELIQAIAHKEAAENFTLAGFSMGSRLLICLGNQLQNQVDRFILLAPAGIGSYDNVAPLYLQRIAEWLLQWPVWFKQGVLLLHRFGWISHFQKRYAEVQIFPKDRRYRLFRVFNSILDFNTSRPLIFNFWQTNSIPTIVVLATRDRMVPNDKIKDYFAKHSNCTFMKIEDKHEMDMEKAAKIIEAMEIWL